MTTKELLKILDLMKNPREGIRAVAGWEFVKHINYPKGEQGIVRLFSFEYGFAGMEQMYRTFFDLLPAPQSLPTLRNIKKEK